jgi:aryl-alcohol dehydrogenase-like predicted oxidoreductase
MTFGREATEADARVQLDRFADAGGNLIDTADVYSSQASESIIGRWLASKPLHVRDQMVVATKGRFPTGGRGPNDHGLSRRHLSGALDASLRRLSVECIDLYQLHAYDPHTPISETLRFLSDAVSAGKIHYVGLSNFTGWQLQYVIDTARHSGFPQPLSLQMQYNLLTREVEWEMAPAALANGVGLLPWSPLGGGWLSGKYERNRQPELDTRLGDHLEVGVDAYALRSRFERTWRIVESVRAVADGRGCSMAQVSLAWLNSRPGVTSVILGARTLAQLEENLAAQDLELTAEELGVLEAASDPDPADYPYGIPGLRQRSRRIRGGHDSVRKLEDLVQVTDDREGSRTT